MYFDMQRRESIGIPGRDDRVGKSREPGGKLCFFFFF